MVDLQFLATMWRLKIVPVASVKKWLTVMLSMMKPLSKINYAYYDLNEFLLVVYQRVFRKTEILQIWRQYLKELISYPVNWYNIFLNLKMKSKTNYVGQHQRGGIRSFVTGLLFAGWQGAMAAISLDDLEPIPQD